MKARNTMSSSIFNSCSNNSQITKW